MSLMIRVDDYRATLAICKKNAYEAIHQGMRSGAGGNDPQPKEAHDVPCLLIYGNQGTVGIFSFLLSPFASIRRINNSYSPNLRSWQSHYLKIPLYTFIILFPTSFSSSSSFFFILYFLYIHIP